MKIWHDAGRADNRRERRWGARGCASPQCGHAPGRHSLSNICLVRGCPCVRYLTPDPKPNKYGARRVEHDDHWHDSIKERSVCFLLEQRQKLGEISHLERQVSYSLYLNGELICRYVADFIFREYTADGHWRLVVADAKGVRTPEYRLKKKMMAASYGLAIREM